MIFIILEEGFCSAFSVFRDRRVVVIIFPWYFFVFIFSPFPLVFNCVTSHFDGRTVSFLSSQYCTRTYKHLQTSFKSFTDSIFHRCWIVYVAHRIANLYSIQIQVIGLIHLIDLQIYYRVSSWPGFFIFKHSLLHYADFNILNRNLSIFYWYEFHYFSPFRDNAILIRRWFYYFLYSVIICFLFSLFYTDVKPDQSNIQDIAWRELDKYDWTGIFIFILFIYFVLVILLFVNLH